jgi:hypothetical protein
VVEQYQGNNVEHADFFCDRHLRHAPRCLTSRIFDFISTLTVLLPCEYCEETQPVNFWYPGIGGPVLGLGRFCPRESGIRGAGGVGRRASSSGMLEMAERDNRAGGEG